MSTNSAPSRNKSSSRKQKNWWQRTQLSLRRRPWVWGAVAFVALLGVLTALLIFVQISQDNRSQASYRGCYQFDDIDGRCYPTDFPYGYCDQRQNLYSTQRECENTENPKPSVTPTPGLKTCFQYSDGKCVRTDAGYVRCNPAQKRYDTRALCRKENGIVITTPTPKPSPTPNQGMFGWSRR
jgi:hypothetical protein